MRVRPRQGSSPSRLVLTILALVTALTIAPHALANPSRVPVEGATTADPLGWRAIAAALNDPKVPWTLCAKQNSRCNFTGKMMVRYGVPGYYAYRLTTNGVMCNNTVFGNPRPGVTKYCSYRAWNPTTVSPSTPVAPARPIVPVTTIPTTTTKPPTTTTPTTAAPTTTTPATTVPVTAPPATSPPATSPPATTPPTTAAPATTGTASASMRPFSANSPWNTPTPAGTSWYDSSILHRIPAGWDMQSFPNGGQLRWWINTSAASVWYGKPTDPLWTFRMPAYIAPTWNRNRPAQTFQVRAPANLMDGGDTDHILVVVNGNTYYEVWSAIIDPVNRVVTSGHADNGGNSGWATGDIVNGPGAGTLANNDGVRAANFSWAGGLITGRDMANGKIDHALALAVTAPMLKARASGAYIAPATAWDNGWGFGPLIMGSRVGIPAGVPRPAGLSPVGVMVFDALQKYGAFVGDFCGGTMPMFYSDRNTVTQSQMSPLYEFWNHGGTSDMDRIIPLLRVADYQP